MYGAELVFEIFDFELKHVLTFLTSYSKANKAIEEKSILHKHRQINYIRFKNLFKFTVLFSILTIAIASKSERLNHLLSTFYND